jgi:hypothetical protein
MPEENKVKTIIAVSSNNQGIKYSLDNGETWQYSNIKTGTFKKPVKFTNGVILVRCAEIGNQGILYTKDGGKIWKPTSLGSGYFEEIVELDNGTLITTSALSDGKSYTSKDGIVWKPIDLGDNFKFLKSDELTVGNSSAYIGQLIENFGSIGKLIEKNNNNVHKIQKELMILQKRTDIEITSSVTGDADPEEFIKTKVDEITPITDLIPKESDNSEVESIKTDVASLSAAVTKLTENTAKLDAKMSELSDKLLSIFEMVSNTTNTTESNSESDNAELGD